MEQQDNQSNNNGLPLEENKKDERKEEIDALIQKFEQPGKEFSEDMNEIMKQVATAVKNYNKQISTIALTSVAEKQTEVDKLTKENADKDVEIERLNNDIQGKNIRIETLESEAKDNQIRIDNLTTINSQKDQKIATLEQEKQADQIRIENATQIMQQKDAELESLRSENETLKAQGQQFRDWFAQMQNSSLVNNPVNEEQPVQKVNTI